MLNPMYVRLIHDQKVNEIEAEIEMKIRCQEGYGCQYAAAPWYTRLAKLIARPRAKKVMAAPCKAC